MSYSDRLTLLAQLLLYLFAMYLVFKAFGPTRRRPFGDYLHKHRLTVVGGQEDAGFVIKTKSVLTEKQFHALVKEHVQFFANEENHV
ncbi:hypothetical protein [Pseudomonas amygdali]|uniref:Uncharacterized protein n=1 Tax=Pseudomonas amygdali pv. lachrymans str. M301315 TaxID=629260 RepID=A0AAD0V9S3_PSEAV|nr:hypothetical protein [Pseudomonas amygdali]AXH59976.1 hypothetical protein PLA107_032640 [Pseudomonas amygdali pv. lachrymans str. M301315]RMT06344.1 hypothetical protein ALP54_03833 [Pseudomonas amygdali pv. lachrymans]